jgi:hypothetical protein
MLGRVVVSEPTTMVGSTSFSSGAWISVIPCFAVQPIAAPCLGCQQNSFWNGQQTEVLDSPIMVKTVHLTLLGRSIPATRVLSVALLYSGHCSLFTTFSTGTSQYQYFLWNYNQQLVPVYLSHFKWVFALLSHGTVLCQN